ncbi:MAG: MarC family protein [Deltaproteobacteria bacterium]|nr:MarC family protein [Deltaproteobacteria bacterium]MBI3296376.1 MarC family protein [Deltaproteobacteria bacterium]
MVDYILGVLNTFVALFVIVDPFAMVPVYLTLTERFSAEAVKRTRRKATFVAFGILSTFGLTGLTVFNLFGITLPAFQIAGGILLLLLGVAQLNNSRPRVKQEETEEGLDREDISVFPLGTPLLAGPGAISTVVLYSTRLDGVLGTSQLILALVMALTATYLVLKGAHFLFRWLGKTGLNLLTRIMGLILTAVAVQFVLNGVKGALQFFQS